MSHYLYAIVDRLPPGWRAPTAGLGGASVVPRRVQGVVVLGSPLEAVPPAGPRTLAVHQDVVATVADAPAVLPFSYGRTVPAGQFPAWLASRHAAVTMALAAVRGRVEMTVKLLCLDGVGRRLARHRPGGPAAGMALAERELRALAAGLAERAGLADWRYRPSGSAGNPVASLAFLVPRDELSAFLARIAPVASHAPGIAVVPTGPWPPYSFVPEWDGLGPAAAPARPFAAAGRRAG